MNTAIYWSTVALYIQAQQLLPSGLQAPAVQHQLHTQTLTSPLLSLPAEVITNKTVLQLLINQFDISEVPHKRSGQS